MRPLNEWLELYAKEIERKEKEVAYTLMVKYSDDKWFKKQSETDTWKAHKELALKSLEDARNRLCWVRLISRQEEKHDFFLEGNEMKEIITPSSAIGKECKVKASEIETFCKNEYVEGRKPTEILIEDPVVAGEAIKDEGEF